MKKRYQAIFILLALFLLYLVLNKIGFEKIIENLKLLRWYYLLIALAMTFAMFAVWNYKWKILVDKVSKIKFWELFPIMMAGLFVDSSTPTFNLGGEPLKAYYLGKKFKKGKAEYLAGIIIDKGMNTLTSLTFIVISLLIAALFFKVSLTAKVVIESIIVVMLAAVAAIFLYKKTKSTILGLMQRMLKKKFKTKKRLEKYIENNKELIISHMKGFYKNKKTLTVSILACLLMQALIFGKSYVFFTALRQSVNPLYIIIAVSIAMVVGQLVVIPGGIGVVESSMISLYALLGISPEIAAIVTILDRITYYTFSLGIGYLSLIYANYKCPT